MNQTFQLVSDQIPEHLVSLFGKERLVRCISILKQTQSIQDLLSLSGEDRGIMQLILEKFIEEKIVVPLSGDISSESLITELHRQDVVESPILLLTDSAADIPEEVRIEKGIVCVPLTVSIDQKEYLDGVEITAHSFYELLKETKSFPVTRPPSQEVFHRIFEENVAQKDILGIFISKKMSETCDIATRTKMNHYNTYVKKRQTNPGMHKKLGMEFIDSKLVSIGTGLLVLEAADRIKQGWPLEKIRHHIERLIDEVRVIFMVDNLDYLVRGGRLGRGSAMVGKLFGLKPILGMDGGGVNARSKAFGGRRAKQKLMEYMQKEIGILPKSLRVGICHANARTKAEEIRTAVAESFAESEQFVTYFGPTVGTHTGPGAVGVAWLPIR